MFALMPGCLIFAGLFIYLQRKNYGVPALLLKGLASLCFAALGILCNAGAESGKPIVLGLILGCVADVLLNLRWVFPAKGQRIFLVGILVFLSGHVLYLAAVLPLSANPFACIVTGIVLTAALMVWIFRQITAKKAFKIFGVFYIGAIMLLNCVAVGNLIAAPSAFTGLFAAGALFFLVSDIVLILNTFGAETRQSLRITNIGLYYIGQLLIALSLRFVP